MYYLLKKDEHAKCEESRDPGSRSFDSFFAGHQIYAKRSASDNR